MRREADVEGEVGEEGEEGGVRARKSYPCPFDSRSSAFIYSFHFFLFLSAHTFLCSFQCASWHSLLQ